LPPPLDGLLPLELQGSNVSVWFGYLASGVRTRGRLRLLSLNYQGSPGKLRTRLLSYVAEVAIAIQRTIAATTPTMVTTPETVARISAGLDHRPLFSCCHRWLTNIILNFCHLCSRR
jgi:hypothetical protein